MTTAIELREVPSQRLLVKKSTCSHKEIGPTFGAAIHSVGESLRASGAEMASMPIAIYLNWRESDCDMAVGCKTRGNVTPRNGCEWLDLPGGPHAFASHYGPYEGLHETHEAIRNWCVTNGRKMSGPCWETYPVDPGSEPDASKWQTDVYYPIS